MPKPPAVSPAPTLSPPWKARTAYALCDAEGVVRVRTDTGEDVGSAIFETRAQADAALLIAVAFAETGRDTGELRVHRCTVTIEASK